MKIQLDNQGTTWFTTTIECENATLFMEFKWAVEIEAIYNSILEKLKNKANSNPLVKNGVYNRDYNILAFVLKNDTYEKYLQSDEKFVDTIGKNAYNALIDEIRAINDEVVNLEEQLVWSYKCTDTFGDTYTGIVRTDCLVNNMSLNYNFRFIAEGIGDQIGRDDLWRVSMEVTSK